MNTSSPQRWAEDLARLELALSGGGYRVLTAREALGKRCRCGWQVGGGKASLLGKGASPRAWWGSGSISCLPDDISSNPHWNLIMQVSGSTRTGGELRVRKFQCFSARGLFFTTGDIWCLWLPQLTSSSSHCDNSLVIQMEEKTSPLPHHTHASAGWGISCTAGLPVRPLPAQGRIHP